MRRTGLLIAVIALLAVPAAAQARDRDHDKLPDKWEKSFHISTKHRSAGQDPDRDGLSNRTEFRLRTNPRRRDTDGDGIRDGREHAGVVTSFNAATGSLTINVANGPSVTGAVNAATRIECESAANAERESHNRGSSTARVSRNGADDGPNHDATDDNGADGPNHDVGDDNGDDATCTTADLIAGAVVREAELRTTSGGLVFEKVELLK